MDPVNSPGSSFVQSKYLNGGLRGRSDPLSTKYSPVVIPTLYKIHFHPFRTRLSAPRPQLQRVNTEFDFWNSLHSTNFLLTNPFLDGPSFAALTTLPYLTFPATSGIPFSHNSHFSIRPVSKLLVRITHHSHNTSLWTQASKF